MKRFNDIDPLGEEVLSFLERLKGTPQIPNALLGEIERWRVIIHFKSCAKIRYVVAKNKNNQLILVTAHPDPDADKYVEIGI